MDYKKIIAAAWGPIKTISLVWIFLIMIITFINFIFFDPQGIFSSLAENPVIFGILNILVAGVLFFFWLIVWNTLIDSFFKEDLRNSTG
ncbi:MAG: hypothetical protein GF308_01650 [Candidatus Heimdallarchaeota archaeon]|nr:hypothetical protein [Candidatus Heimdallarchaeota archaeon]